MQPRIILHIGGAKCGSSSLQTFLTSNPKLVTQEGLQVEYWQVKKNDNSAVFFAPVVTGNVLRGLRYQNSGSLTWNLERYCIHKIFENFIEINGTRGAKTFVFSYEGWSSEFQSSKLARCTCIKSNFKVSIYLHVRPQTRLLTSAYLQWHLWSDNPTLETSFSRITKHADWEVQVKNAYQLGADEVIVRFSSDIVSDFCEAIGIDQTVISKPLRKRINTSLPLEAVNLLLRNRKLRSGPHDGWIDFLLEDLLDDIGFSLTPARIKVSEDLIIRVEKHFHDNNVKLSKRMTRDHYEAFNEDLARSREKLIDGIDVESLFSGGLNVEFLEKLSVSLLTTLREIRDYEACCLTECDSAVAERDSAVAERDSAVAERDSAVAERDSAVAERDSAVAEREYILGSTTWKIFGPYRRVKKFIRKS